MPAVLITGANRGIGLEFARQYSSTGWDVIATARHSSPELDSLGVRVEQLDLSDADAVAAFPANIGGPLEQFIANAGTNHPMNGESAEGAHAWQAMMMVNAIAPYVLGKALLPRMAEGGKMIAISSGMGSIGDIGGGWVPYRTSKAALNMAWSSLALEARPRGISCVLFSPGWVQTRMGGRSAPLPPQDSVAGMRRVIDNLGPAQSGGFFSYDGSQIPW